MKTLCIATLIALIGGIQAADLIPVRAPEIGESRPAWWWSIWTDHVVVIEGTIEWNDDREPEIQISADLGVLKNAVGEEDAKFIHDHRNFRIGRLTPKKLIFASPGITTTNLIFAEIKAGENHELRFLLPVRQFRDTKVFRAGAKNRESGIFIFNYGSMLITLPLVFESAIPEDGIASANAVFNHRSTFDHQIPQKPSAE